MSNKPFMLLALTIATGCATDDPTMRDTSQAVVGCDMFDDLEVGPDMLGGDIDTLGYGDTWNYGCEIDPLEPGGGLGFGFCPSQTRSAAGDGSSETDEDGARASARAEAYARASRQCNNYFYFPSFPSYCDGGYESGFSVSDSCLRPFPDLYPNYWRCSAQATVTCSGYTWHAW